LSGKGFKFRLPKVLGHDGVTELLGFVNTKGFATGFPAYDILEVFIRSTFQQRVKFPRKGNLGGGHAFLVFFGCCCGGNGSACWSGERLFGVNFVVTVIMFILVCCACDSGNPDDGVQWRSSWLGSDTETVPKIIFPICSVALYPPHHVCSSAMRAVSVMLR
jgi:hypothetical protein